MRKARRKTRKTKRSSAKKNPRRRKVLHGAAKVAHAKKQARLRARRSARKNPVRKHTRHSKKRSAGKNPTRRHKRRKVMRARANPSKTLKRRVDALSTKVHSMDSRLHRVEKHQKITDRMIGRRTRRLSARA